jgi:excisionase family DNA binding protein
MKNCATPVDRIVAGLPPLLTRKEAAALLRCRPDHISRLIAAGELLGVQRRQGAKGAPVLVTRDSIRAYLERSVVS